MADSLDSKHSTRDAFYDPFCDPCFLADGLNVKVFGYCKDCVQFLCTDCHKVHRNLHATRNHLILREANMPQSQSEKLPRFDYCDDHPKHLRDKFCSGHKVLICSICSLSYHKKCSVQSADEVCKVIPTSKIVALYDDIKNVQDRLKSVMSSVETEISKMNEQKKTMLKEAQTVYDQFISKVNTLFQDIQSEIETKHHSQIDSLTQHQARINDIIVILESSLTDIDNLKGKPVDSKLFPRIQEVVYNANQFVHDFNDINQSLCWWFVSMSFVPNKTIQEVLSSSVTFGSVAETRSQLGTQMVMEDIAFYSHLQTQAPSRETSHKKPVARGQVHKPSGPLSQIKALKQGSYDMSLQDNKTNCYITGMAITKDGRRLIADYNNEKVTLFSKDMQFLSAVSVADQPLGIAVLSDKEAAVSTFNNSLVILDISDSQLRIKTTTQLSYKVRGITKYNDKLVITCPDSNPPSVKLIDQTGRVYWSVSDDQQGQPLFKDPQYVSSHDGGSSSSVIVTDSGNNSLTLLNGDTGEVITRRQVTGKFPKGVTTDTAGNVYACYTEPGEMLVMSGDLSEEKFLLSVHGGLSDLPQAIVYDDTAHQLIVSYLVNNCVDCFILY